MKLQGGKFMKILIAGIIPFMGIVGGLEKVVINFANEMTTRGHKVAIAYCNKNSGERPYLPIDDRVQLINMVEIANGKKWTTPSLKYRLMREAMRVIDKKKMKNLIDEFMAETLHDSIKTVVDNVSPDIIVTVNAQTTAVFFMCGEAVSCPIITMSHGNAKMIWANASDMEKRMLEKSDILQVLMPADASFFQKYLNVKIVHIPNVVPQYDTNVIVSHQKQKLIIEVARLEKKEKRQHLLIEAFSKIAKDFPAWKLELWGPEQGGGNYIKELQQLIKRNHLEKQVEICGNTDDVVSVYRKSDIFAFPSASEGFPLAMTEAMSAGLPVVAYKNCPAVNELVKSGETGILVSDGVLPLADGLRQLMQDKELRLRMGKNAHEAMKKYVAKKIWDQWENLMIEMI